MTEGIWRPLGFEGEHSTAYDALHDGVPAWMAESFWAWMRSQFVAPARNAGTRAATTAKFRASLLMEVERVCRVTVAYTGASPRDGMAALRDRLTKTKSELRVADFLLANEDAVALDRLDSLLQQSGSRWKVGVRSDKRGLVRRVPEGAQVNADHVMASSGDAGVKLAQAWGRVFGVSPDATGGYALAVRAVEDAAIPVVVPVNKQAKGTLGDVIRALEGDGNWSLPLTREDCAAPTKTLVTGMIRALWRGHHDRHGGVSGAGPVSQEEAETAVTLAVPLVQWFSTGMVQQR